VAVFLYGGENNAQKGTGAFFGSDADWAVLIAFGWGFLPGVADFWCVGDKPETEWAAEAGLIPVG